MFCWFFAIVVGVTYAQTPLSCLLAPLPNACVRLTVLSNSSAVAAVDSECGECAADACSRIDSPKFGQCADVTDLRIAWTTHCAGRNVTLTTFDYKTPQVTVSLPVDFPICVQGIPRGQLAADASRCSCTTCNDGTKVGDVSETYTAQFCGSCCGPTTCNKQTYMRRCLCLRDSSNGDYICKLESKHEDQHVQCGVECDRSSTGQSISPLLWLLFGLFAFAALGLCNEST